MAARVDMSSSSSLPLPAPPSAPPPPSSPPSDSDPVLVRLGLGCPNTLSDDELLSVLEPLSHGWCRIAPAIFTPSQPVSLDRAMPLLLRFESVYQRFIAHHRLELEDSSDIKLKLWKEPSSSFLLREETLREMRGDVSPISPPSASLVLAALRFSCTLISHCSKSALFPSVRSCLCLLNSDDQSIVIAVLYWLAQFQHGTTRIMTFSAFQAKYSVKIRPYLVFLASGFYGGQRMHALPPQLQRLSSSASSTPLLSSSSPSQSPLAGSDDIEELIGESEIVSLSVAKAPEELMAESLRYHSAFSASYAFHRTTLPVPDDMATEAFPSSLSLTFALALYERHRSDRWHSMAHYVRWLSQYYQFGPPHFYRLCHILRFARHCQSLQSRRLYVILRLMSYQCLMSFSQMRKDLIHYFEYLSDRFLEDVIALIRDEQRVPSEIRAQAWMTLAHFSSVSVVRDGLRTLGLGSHAVIMTSLKAALDSVKSYQSVILASVRTEEAHIEAAMRSWPKHPPEPMHDSEVDRAAAACTHAEAIFSYIERLIPRTNENSAFEPRISCAELLELLVGLIGDREVRLGSLLMRAVTMVDALLSVSPSSIARFHAISGLDAFFDRIAHIVRFRVSEDDTVTPLFVVAPPVDPMPSITRKVIAPAAFLTIRTVLDKLIITANNAVRAAQSRAPVRAQALKDGSFSAMIQQMWRQASGVDVEIREEMIENDSQASSSATAGDSNDKDSSPAKRRRTGRESSAVVASTSQSQSSAPSLASISSILQPIHQSSCAPRSWLFSGRYRWGPEFFSQICSLVNVLASNHPPILKQFHAEGCTKTLVQLLDAGAQALLNNPPHSQHTSFLASVFVLRVIPETLRSFCLVSEVLEFIQSSTALKSLMSIFLAPAACDLLVLDRPILYFLAKSVDEMCRHNKSLQPLFLREIGAVLQELDKQAPVIEKLIEQDYYDNGSEAEPSSLSSTEISNDRWVLYSRRLIAIGRFLEMLNRFIPQDLIKANVPQQLMKIALLRNRRPALSGLMQRYIHVPETHALLSSSTLSSSASIAAHSIVQATTPSGVITTDSKPPVTEEAKTEEKDRSAHERANANEFNSFITPLLHMVKDPATLLHNVGSAFVTNMLDLQSMIQQDQEYFLAYPTLTQRLTDTDTDAVSGESDSGQRAQKSKWSPFSAVMPSSAAQPSSPLTPQSPESALRQLQQALCLLQALDWTSLALARLTRRVGPVQFVDGSMPQVYGLLMDVSKRVHWAFAAHWAQQRMFEVYVKNSNLPVPQYLPFAQPAFPSSASSALLPLALYHQSLSRFLYHTIKLFQALIKLTKPNRPLPSATDSYAKKKLAAQEKLSQVIAKGLVTMLSLSTPAYITAHWLDMGDSGTPPPVDNLAQAKYLRGALRLVKLSLFSGSAHELNNELFMAFRKEAGGEKILNVLRWALNQRMKAAYLVRAQRLPNAEPVAAEHRHDAEIMSMALDEVLNEIGSLTDQLSRYENLPEQSQSTALPITAANNPPVRRHALHPVFNTGAESPNDAAGNASSLSASIDATSLDLSARMMEESGGNPQPVAISAPPISVEVTLASNPFAPGPTVVHIGPQRARSPGHAVIGHQPMDVSVAQSIEQPRTLLSALPALPAFSPRTTVEPIRIDASIEHLSSSPMPSPTAILITSGSVHDTGVDKFSSLVARECWRTVNDPSLSWNGGLFLANAFDCLPSHFVTLMLNVTMRWANKARRDEAIAMRHARVLFLKQAQSMVASQASEHLPLHKYGANRLAHAIEATRSEDPITLKIACELIISSRGADYDPPFGSTPLLSGTLETPTPSPRVALFGDIDVVHRIVRPMVCQLISVHGQFLQGLLPLQLSTVATPPPNGKLPAVHGLVTALSGWLCTLCTFDTQRHLMPSVTPPDTVTVEDMVRMDIPESVALLRAPMHPFHPDSPHAGGMTPVEFVRLTIIASITEAFSGLARKLDLHVQQPSWTVEIVELLLYQCHAYVHLIHNVIANERKNSDHAGDQLCIAMHQAIAVMLRVQSKLHEKGLRNTDIFEGIEHPLSTPALIATRAEQRVYPALKTLMTSVLFLSNLIMEIETNETLNESDVLPMVALLQPLAVPHTLDSELAPQPEQFLDLTGYMKHEYQRELMDLILTLLPNTLAHGESLPPMIDMIARLTRNRLLVDHFLSKGGLRMLLSLPSADNRNPLEPRIPSVSSHMDTTGMSVVLAHCLTVPSTLQQQFEKEIITVLTEFENVIAQSKHQYNKGLTLSKFVSLCSLLIKREPAIFARAVQRVAVVEQLAFEVDDKSKPPQQPVHRLRIRLRSDLNNTNSTDASELVSASKPSSTDPAAPTLQRSASDRTPASSKSRDRPRRSHSRSKPRDTMPASADVLTSSSSSSSPSPAPFDWEASEKLVRAAYKDFLDALVLDLMRSTSRVMHYTQKLRDEKSGVIMTESQKQTTVTDTEMKCDQSGADAGTPAKAPLSKSETASASTTNPLLSDRELRKVSMNEMSEQLTTLGFKVDDIHGMSRWERIQTIRSSVNRDIVANTASQPPLTPMDITFRPLLDHATLVNSLQTALQWENPDLLPALQSYNPSQCAGVALRFQTLPSFLMQVVLTDPTQLFSNILGVTDFLIVWALASTFDEEKQHEAEMRTEAQRAQQSLETGGESKMMESDEVPTTPKQPVRHKPQSSLAKSHSTPLTAISESSPLKAKNRKSRPTVAQELIQLICGFLYVILTQPPPPNTLKPWFRFTANSKRKGRANNQLLIANQPNTPWQTVVLPKWVKPNQLLQQINQSKEFHRVALNDDPLHPLRFNQLLTAQSGLVQLLASLLSRGPDSAPSPFVRKRHVSWMIESHAPPLIAGLFQWIDLEPRSTHKVALAIVTAAERTLETILKMNAMYGLDGQQPATLPKPKKWALSMRDRMFSEAIVAAMEEDERDMAVLEGDEDDEPTDAELDAIIRQMVRGEDIDDGDDDDEIIDEDISIDDDVGEAGFEVGEEDIEDGEEDVDDDDDEEGMMDDDDDDELEDEEDEAASVNDADSLPVGGVITVDEDEDEFGEGYDDPLDDDGDDDNGDNAVLVGEGDDDDGEEIEIDSMDDDLDENEEDALIGAELGLDGEEEPQPSASDSEAEAEAQEAAGRSVGDVDAGSVSVSELIGDDPDRDGNDSVPPNPDDFAHDVGVPNDRAAEDEDQQIAREVNDEIEIDENDALFDDPAFSDDAALIETHVNRVGHPSQSDQANGRMLMASGPVELHSIRYSSGEGPFGQLSDTEFQEVRRWARQIAHQAERRGQRVPYGINLFATSPSSHVARRSIVVDNAAVIQTLQQYQRHLQHQPHAHTHPHQTHIRLPMGPVITINSNQPGRFRDLQPQLLDHVGQILGGLVAQHSQSQGRSAAGLRVVHGVPASASATAAALHRALVRRPRRPGFPVPETSSALIVGAEGSEADDEDRMTGGVSHVVGDDERAAMDGADGAANGVVAGDGQDDEETDGSDDEQDRRVRRLSRAQQRPPLPAHSPVAASQLSAAAAVSLASNANARSDGAVVATGRSFHDLRAHIEDSWIELHPVQAHTLTAQPRPAHPPLTNLNAAAHVIMFRLLVRIIDMDAVIHIRVRKAAKKQKDEVDSSQLSQQSVNTSAESNSASTEAATCQSSTAGIPRASPTASSAVVPAAVTSTTAPTYTDTSENSAPAITTTATNDEDDEEAELRAAVSLSMETATQLPAAAATSPPGTASAAITSSISVSPSALTPPTPPDAAVLAELPEDIRREVMLDYRRQLANFRSRELRMRIDQGLGSEPNNDEFKSNDEDSAVLAASLDGRPPPPPDVDPEVWNLLPLEIQSEMLAAHVLDAGDAANGSTSNAAVEIDPATIIHTLSSEAREDFMLGMSEDQLFTLPASVLAEALALRNRSSGTAYHRSLQQQQQRRQAANAAAAAASISQPANDESRSPAVSENQESPQLAPMPVNAPPAGEFPPELNFAALTGQRWVPPRASSEEEKHIEEEKTDAASMDVNAESDSTSLSVATPARRALDLSLFSSTDELHTQRPGHSLLSTPFLMPLVRVLYMTPVIDTQIQQLQKIAQHLIAHQGTRHALLAFLTAILRTTYLAPIAQFNPHQSQAIMHVTEKVEPEISLMVMALPREALGRAEESQAGALDELSVPHPLHSLVMLRIIDFIRFLVSKMPYLVTLHFFKPAAASALAIKLAEAFDARTGLLMGVQPCQSSLSSSAEPVATPARPPLPVSSASKSSKKRSHRQSRGGLKDENDNENQTPKKRVKRALSHSSKSRPAHPVTTPITPSTAVSAAPTRSPVSSPRSQSKRSTRGGQSPILEFFAMLRSPQVCASSQSMYYIIRVLADLVELPLKHISEVQALRARAAKRRGSVDDIDDLSRPAYLDIPITTVPILPSWCVHALLMTMTSPGYSERHMELATKVLLLFAEREENATTIVKEIGLIALDTAKKIENDLKQLILQERQHAKTSVSDASESEAVRKRRRSEMTDSKADASQSTSAAASQSPFSNPYQWQSINREAALLCFIKLLNTFNLIDGHEPSQSPSVPSPSHAHVQNVNAQPSAASAFVRLPNSSPAPTLLTPSRVEAGRVILSEMELFLQLRELWQTFDDYFTVVENNDGGSAPITASVPSTPSANVRKQSRITGDSKDEAKEADGKDESVQAKVKHLLDKKAVDDRRHDLTEENHTEKESDLQLLMHLPLLECLFIVCAPRTADKQLAKTQRQNSSNAITPAASTPASPAQTRSLSLTSQSSVPAASASLDYAFYFSFAVRHRRVLNVCCRSQPHLLKHGSGPFHSLVWHPHKVLDFDIRRRYFRGELKRLSALQRQANPGSSMAQIRLHIRRNLIFEDSYAQLDRVPIKDWKNRLTIRFHGEEGLDAGGLLREWFLFLSRAIFNPNYALFEACPANPAIFQPNKSSSINSEHLRFFKFVGRLVGKALHDGQRLDAYFTRSFLKHMLGISVNFHDLESVDPAYYNNLVWMLQNDIEGVIEETFAATVSEFGNEKTVDLIPNGRNIPVTNNNKVDYVNALAEFRLTQSIKSQIDAFLEGFNELIPSEVIAIFNEHELELLLCGLPSIDLHDLAANIEYKGFTPHDPTVQWMWTLLHEMNTQEKALLMLFVTGTSKIPLEGFKALQGANGITPFTVQKSDKPVDSLPEAHTCFAELDTRVLTDSGFAFRDEILARLRRGESVLYACYDKASQSIVYKTGKLMKINQRVTRVQELVNLTADSEVCRWAPGSDEYGRGLETGDDPTSGHVSLRVTRGHRMYCQLGTVGGTQRGITVESSRPILTRGRRGPVVNDPPRTCRADSLLMPQCSCSDVDCEHARAGVRLYGVAENGAVLPASLMPEAKGTAADVQHNEEMGGYDDENEQLLQCVATHRPSEPAHSPVPVCAPEVLRPVLRDTGAAFDNTNARSVGAMVATGRSFDNLLVPEDGSVDPSIAALAAIDHECNPNWRAQLMAALRLTSTSFPVFLGLFGFWIGDGSIAYKCPNKKSVDAVIFCQRKSEDSEWLKEELPKCGLVLGRDYRLSESGGKSRIDVIAPHWFHWFDYHYGRKYQRSRFFVPLPVGKVYTQSTKWFLAWVWRLLRDELRIVLDGLRRADGSWKGNTKEIFTSSAVFRDALLTALMHAGFSPFAWCDYTKGIIRGYRVDGEVWSEEDAENEGRTEQPIQATVDSWTVSYVEPTIGQGKDACCPHLHRQRDIRVEPYVAQRDGALWCVQVDHPDHLIVAQRAHRVNGVVKKMSIPLIVGNCFNCLDLPEYSSLEVMRHRLHTAIKEGSQGFGFR